MTPAVGVLDSNILVDLWRQYPLAITWMGNNRDLALAIPSRVRKEMILGSRNKAELEKVAALMKPFPLIHPSEADAQWAMEQFEKYFLSHQIEIIDCFVAALATRLELPVYTRNVKDYAVFRHLTIYTPY